MKWRIRNRGSLIACHSRVTALNRADRRHERMRAAAQSPQLVAGIGKIGGFVEPCFLANEDLVGPDDDALEENERRLDEPLPRRERAHRPPHHGGLRLGNHVSATLRPGRRFDPEIETGGGQQPSPRDTRRSEDQLLSHSSHDDAPTIFMIAAAVSSIERRVTSITGQCICAKIAPRLAHLGAHRLDIGIFGRTVVMQQVQPVTAQLDQPLGIVGQTDDQRVLGRGSAPAAAALPAHRAHWRL